MELVLGFILGVSAGLRSMTPLAIVAWTAQLGWPALRQTQLAFLAAPITSYALTAFACIELVFDKLPIAPSRLGAGPLGARVVSGALCSAALVVVAGGSPVVGGIVGAVGGIAGAYGGYHVRRHLTGTRKLPDLPVALAEDLVAIGSALFAVSRFP